MRTQRVHAPFTPVTILVAAFALGQPVAHAEPGHDRDDVTEECTSAAEALSEVHRYADAAKKSRDCWETIKDPAFLIREAQYWRKAGFHAHAMQAYQHYLDNAALDDPSSTRPQIAESGKLAEQSLTASVSLRFDPPIRQNERVLVRLEHTDAERPAIEVEATTSLIQIFLDSGAWGVHFIRNGLLSTDTQVTVREGVRNVSATLRSRKPQPVTPVPSPTLDPPQAPPKYWKGLLGGGIASISIGGVVFGVAAWSRNRALRDTRDFNNYSNEHDCDQPPANETCSKKHQAAVDSRSHLKLEIVGWVAAPALVTAGAVMIVMSRRILSQPRGELIPEVSLTGAGLTWQHKF